jgi:hypothetical protein
MASSNCLVAFSEFVIRQPRSAFSTARRPSSSLTPEGTTSRTRTRNRVNCDARSTRSKVPLTSQRSEVQGNSNARAIDRNVNTKQSATAATSSVSGDQRSPGPSNSAGGAECSSGNPSPRSSRSPSGAPTAVARYSCERFHCESPLVGLSPPPRVKVHALSRRHGVSPARPQQLRVLVTQSPYRRSRNLPWMAAQMRRHDLAERLTTRAKRPSPARHGASSRRLTNVSRTGTNRSVSGTRIHRRPRRTL